MPEQFQSRFIKIYSIFFISVFLGGLFYQLTDEGLTQKALTASVSTTLNAIYQRFLWRQTLIEDFDNFRFLLGDRVFYNVIAGNDGWLFFTGDQSLADYQKTLGVSPKDLQTLAKGFTQMSNQAARNGGRLMVVITPDKQTIYPQYVPAQIPVLGKKSRADILTDFLQQNGSKATIVDLRPVLQKASLSTQTYYHTDTHWNCLGAYYGYQEILAKLSAANAKIKPYSLSDFNVSADIFKQHDIPRMLGFDLQESGWRLEPKLPQEKLKVKYEILKNGARVKIVTSRNKQLPKVLVLHDSFYALCLSDLFERNFSRIASVPLTKINKDAFFQLIKTEKPDFVLFEFVERTIGEVTYFLQSK